MNNCSKYEITLITWFSYFTLRLFYISEEFGLNNDFVVWTNIYQTGLKSMVKLFFSDFRRIL